MGILGDLFGNSKIKEFKNKFIKVYNLLSNISYGDMPRDIGLQKAEKEYDIFIAIARSFDDPFAEYFNLYASTTTVFGEKTSVAEAIVIIYLAKKNCLGVYEVVKRRANNDNIASKEYMRFISGKGSNT